MKRSELRRQQKEQKAPEKSYMLTQSQINDIRRQAADQATTLLAEQTFLLMMALPIEVLITEDYWMKSAKKKIPKFINDLLILYKGYEQGQITIEEMKKDLWDFAGVQVGKKEGVTPCIKE